MWLNIALDLTEVKGKEKGKIKALSKSEQRWQDLFRGPLLAERGSAGEKRRHYGDLAMVGGGAEMLIIFERQTENFDVLMWAAASHYSNTQIINDQKKMLPEKSL